MKHLLLSLAVALCGMGSALTQGCLPDVVTLCAADYGEYAELEICSDDGMPLVLAYESGNFYSSYSGDYIGIYENGVLMAQWGYTNYSSVYYESAGSCVTVRVYISSTYGCNEGYGTPFSFSYESTAEASDEEVVTPGCMSYYALNYDANSTNSLACEYADLQELLLQGITLDDLVASGVEECDLLGLFAAGGVVVDVDKENSRALIGMTYTYWSTDDLTGSLRGDEFLDVTFDTKLYGGQHNWAIIKNSYGTRYPASTGAMAGQLGMLNILGYNDWFIPNLKEIQRYQQLYNSGYVPSQTVYWPIDPNGGTSTFTMTFPPSYFTASYNMWTSDLTNYGESTTAQYRLSNGGSGPGSSGYYIRPMRVEILDPPATVSNCSDWQYGDAGNQAINIGVPCLYPLFQCDSTESALWDQLVIGAYPANTTVVEFGRDDTRDVLLNVPSTHTIDGNIYDVVGYEVATVENVPVGLDVNLETGDVIGGGEVHCLAFSGTAMQEGIYDLDITGTLYMNILGSVLATDILMEHRVVVTPNVTGIEGCMYPSADNYDPLATLDSGACLFDGLCPGDFDNDGLIGILDILHILGLYDTTCD